ncbi:cell wall-binding repeat-containing protein [Euzebya sp.]|uniref:cell wall-binding repeat-containing protein n=1 Tax=Euzebya sp. TaxID=1971409 RepID=UPI003515E112
MRHLTLLLTVAMLALGLLAGPAVGAVSDTIDIRGDDVDLDPTEIALRFSRATFTEDDAVTEVLLATTETFADALASGTLQGDSPLLLTGPDELDDDVAAEIDRLEATDVTILGGEAAIDADVEEDLEDLGLDVARLAGETRLATAVEVAEQAETPSTAIVARAFGAAGDDTQAFADALAAGAWAAETGWPILLTQTDHLAVETEAFLTDGDVDRVMLLGGEAAIGTDVEEAIEALDIDVDRVAGPTRFHTATAIAEARGFDSAAEAERIILVEGQADDAWAAGFAAAAHGAIAEAPVLLANGDTLPPATTEFLISTSQTFAVDATDVDEPVLVCATSATACEQARILLGLPAQAELTFENSEQPIPSRTPLIGTIDTFDVPARVAVFGECVTEGLLTTDADGGFAVEIAAEPGPCTITFEIAYENGSVQTTDVVILVDPAIPAEGIVVGTSTGSDAYTFVATDADVPLTVSYDDEDVFTVDGEPATIGAFEAAVTVADRVTFTADTAEGDVHDLVNVDPATISSGTLGDVDVAAGTFAIVEPVTGVVLRPGLEITDDRAYQVDGEASTREGFEANANEGDEVSLTTSSIRLRNRVVEGPALDISVDAVSGIARLRIGGLGDDPLTAEDDRFRARAGTDAQTFEVDGDDTDFAAFAEALSVGDEVTYDRRGGVEAFEIDNAPVPPVAGTVTETFDPDGSAAAPEPADGGDIVALTVDGRILVSYSADAVFRIDDRVATEEEFEAARTAGDAVSYQVGDPATGTPEEIALVNRDLSGEVTDITEGANTYDVTVQAGIVYDDLDYTSSIFGGSDVYVINGDTVGLAQFENQLALIDRGEVLGTITVRATDDGTEHRLSSEAQR